MSVDYNATIGVFGCPPTIVKFQPQLLKTRSRTANSDFWSWLTHQLLGRLISTHPNLHIYSPFRQSLRSWGWGLTIHPGQFFFLVCRWTIASRGLMTGILESWSLQLRNDTKMLPQLKSFFFPFPFFHRRMYSLWLWDALAVAWSQPIRAKERPSSYWKQLAPCQSCSTKADSPQPCYSVFGVSGSESPGYEDWQSVLCSLFFIASKQRHRRALRRRCWAPGHRARLRRQRRTTRMSRPSRGRRRRTSLSWSVQELRVPYIRSEKLSSSRFWTFMSLNVLFYYEFISLFIVLLVYALWSA